MYKVEYFVCLDGCSLKADINAWLKNHPNIIPINISINENACRAMLLYKVG